MNRKQKEVKRLNATRHKEKCLWLKGGTPRRYKKMKGVFVSRGIRISRKRLHDISNKTMQAYLDKAKEIEALEYLEL